MPIRVRVWVVGVVWLVGVVWVGLVRVHPLSRAPEPWNEGAQASAPTFQSPRA